MPVDSRVISAPVYGLTLYRIDYLQIFSLCSGSFERAQALPLRERGKRKVLHIKVASPRWTDVMSDLSPSAAMGFGVADSLSEVKGSKFVGQCK